MDLVTTKRPANVEIIHAPSLRQIARRMPLDIQGQELGELGFDWGSIIGQGFDFGKTFLNNKYAKDAAKYGAGQYVQQQPQGTTPAQQIDPAVLALLQKQQQQGVGFGFDSEGLRMSDGSHISWMVIFIVILAFFLLQSRPLSRK
jgi:hypothetical protein